MKAASISVVITTFNDHRYLKKAITSTLDQSLLPKQIIVVDDGSKSNKASIITEEYLLNEYGVEFIFVKIKNSGPSNARNLGIKLANQDFITFLDADDEMLKNNLSDKYSVLTKLSNNYFGVYGCGLVTKGKNQDFIDYDGIANTNDLGMFDKGVPGGCCFYLFRLSALKEVDGFDEDLINNEDFDLLIRLTRLGKLCKGSVGYTNLIRITKNSLSRGGNHKKRFDNVMIFLDKAEKYQYLDMEEINRRKKIHHLILFRKKVIRSPFESIYYLRQGFLYGKPVGWKQKLLYNLLKVKQLDKG